MIQLAADKFLEYPETKERVIFKGWKKQVQKINQYSSTVFPDLWGNKYKTMITVHIVKDSEGTDRSIT